MMDRTALILLDCRSSRHSVNALVGALEADEDFRDLELRLPSNEARLREHIAEAHSDGKRPIVGISFATPQLWSIHELMVRVSGRVGVVAAGADALDRTRAVWIAGGPHPTADAEGTLGMGFDVVVRGEGEAALLELLKTIAGGGDLGEVGGITYRGASGKLQSTRRGAPVDLDAYGPFPLWRRRVVGPIEITRGCPYRCGYCQTPGLLGGQPRHRGIEMVARYAGVIRQRKLRDVRVISPNAFSYGSADGKALNLPALEALLGAVRAAIGEEGRLFFGTFPSEVRPEHVNEETLRLVRRYANNTQLVIGAQSGSEQVLERCGRGHGVADILTAASRTVAAGLTPHVDFVFGLPGETSGDVLETIAVIREVVAVGALIHVHAFMPLPQTRFAMEAPGRVDGRARALLKELNRRGILTGYWQRQEREAVRISEYNRQRMLCDGA